EVVTTSGVVTAACSEGGFDGYYIRTPGSGGDTDLDERTASDAVFVYSPDTVDDGAIGDYVEVTGEVSEFNGLTEITVADGGVVELDEAAEAVKPVAFRLPEDDERREVLDRKSTRLNSSHVKISYAVFCLKKKK